jgi:hypothetical protein
MSTFKDSANIIIENDGPKYYFPGDSYLEKLKNGIPLEYMFELENHLSTFNVESCVSVELSSGDCLNINIGSDSDYEIDEPDITFPKKRKGKWIPLKKTVASNFKKNKIKQLGYDDKQFNLEQNTIFDFVSDSDNDSDYYDDDSSYQGHTYHIVRQVKESERLFL